MLISTDAVFSFTVIVFYAEHLRIIQFYQFQFGYLLFNIQVLFTIHAINIIQKILCTILLIQFAFFAAICQTNNNADVDRMLAQIVKGGNTVKAYSIVTEALNISTKINYRTGQAKALLYLAAINSDRFIIDSAQKQANEALRIAQKEKLKEIETEALETIGYCYEAYSDFEKAFATYNKSLDIAKDARDSFNIAKVHSKIANLMVKMKNYDVAVKYANLAIGYFERTKSLNELATAYFYLGNLYENTNNYKEAFRYSFKAIAMYDSLKLEPEKSDPYQTIGLSYYYSDKIDSALEYFYKAYDAANLVSNNKSTDVLCYFIGAIYDDKNKYDSCFKYYSMALKIGKDLKNYNLISGINSNLAKLYALRLGDYKTAYKYSMLATEARDSSYETDRVKTLSEMTVKFETKETEAKNKLLQNENDLQKLRLQRKNLTTYGLLGFIALLSLAAFLWIRQNRIKSKQEIIELEQKQLRSQMDPHFLFNCLNSIQHYIVHSDPVNANKYLSEFATLVRKTLNISSEISISLADEIEYLENYLSLEKMRFENKLDYIIKCANDIDKKSVQVPPMIIQPFIENAVHHGLRYLKDSNGMLAIDFYKEGNNLVCTIDDNGIGINASQQLKEQLNSKYISQGINITQKRLALIGKIKKSSFDLKIEDKLISTGKSGTLVTIKFPM